MEKSKSRTAITIDPDLWDRAKAYCEKNSTHGNKLSFSALVEDALKSHLLAMENFEQQLKEIRTTVDEPLSMRDQ